MMTQKKIKYKMYCLFMYRQRGFSYEKTIITKTLEEMKQEIDHSEDCCTVRCCKDEILEKLNDLTCQTINNPIHWTDKHHGFCLFIYKGNNDQLRQKIYDRYTKDPTYNNDIYTNYDCSED